MHILILIGVQNKPERYCFLLKNVPFEAFLRWRRSLLCQLFVYILTIYAKCLLFQFLSGSILMLIAILTWVQNERTNLWKNSQILLKNVVFAALCPRWRSLVCQLFFDILSIYHKYHLFLFFSRGIRVHIPILTGVQKFPESHQNNSVSFASFQCGRSLVCQLLILYSLFLL